MDLFLDLYTSHTGTGWYLRMDGGSDNFCLSAFDEWNLTLGNAFAALAHLPSLVVADLVWHGHLIVDGVGQLFLTTFNVTLCWKHCHISFGHCADTCF